MSESSEISTVVLTAESLAHGGECIAHLPAEPGEGARGQVVFVSGAAPGDQIEAQLMQAGRGPEGDRSKWNYLRAKTLRLVEAGPNRVAPPCPIVEQCGGCPLQQMSAASQLEGKRVLAIDALARIGGIADAAVRVEPIVASPRDFGYRRRARMHRIAGESDPKRQWGFAGLQSDRNGKPELVPVESCLLFEPKLQELADAVRPLLAEQGGVPEVSDLGLLVDSEGRGAIDLRTAHPPSTRLRHKLETMVRKLKGLRGATVGPLGKSVSIGEPILADGPGESGARLRTRPDLFAQANRFILPKFEQLVLQRLGPAARGRVLELFCGAGTLTLPLLAAGARAVIGVEEAGPSLSLLRKSAEEAGLTRGASSDAEPRLKLIEGDAAQIAASLRVTERGRLDAVLLDPPRTGAPAAVRAAAELNAPRIVYVSCDAPTLARDAKALAQSGYQLEIATPLDLFPQTAHFEVVALFVK